MSTSLAEALSKIPQLTPYACYCQARAVVAMGREFPTAMLNNDPRLMLDAMMGVEDAKSARRTIPTQAAIMEIIDAAIPPDPPIVPEPAPFTAPPEWGAAMGKPEGAES